MVKYQDYVARRRTFYFVLVERMVVCMFWQYPMNLSVRIALDLSGTLKMDGVKVAASSVKVAQTRFKNT